MEAHYNILFISSWYPSRVHRTIGNFVERHAQAVALKHNVTVLYLCSDPTIESTEVELRKDRGMSVVRVYFRPGTFRPRDHYQALHLGIDFLHKNNLDKFDIIHGNVLYPAAMQAIILQRHFHIPFIFTEHWTGFHRESGSGMGLAGRLMLKHACRKAARICPVSDHLGVSMKKWGLKADYHTVANVVDTQLFQPAEKNEKFRFIHVSSLLDEHKNISGMLRAIKKVLEKDPDFEFWMVGDGDITPHVEYAKQLNIDPNAIHFLEEQPLDSIAKLMSSAHVFMMFSHYENLPCVILEAFSCGIPVISSDTGGIREHLDPSRGILVTNGIEDELERAILQMKRGYSDFNAAEIRQYAIDNFSEESIATQFTEVYSQILGND